jgi:hypothetical protein
MAQFYICFIKNFVIIIAPIIKLTRKIKILIYIKQCQKAWVLIKQKYIEESILMLTNWKVEFHVHTNASLLIIRVMLSQNLIRKSVQLVVYASRLLNKSEQNYSIT